MYLKKRGNLKGQTVAKIFMFYNIQLFFWWVCISPSWKDQKASIEDLQQKGLQTKIHYGCLSLWYVWWYYQGVLFESKFDIIKCKCHHHYFQTKDSSSLAFVRRKESPHFTPCYSQGAVWTLCHPDSSCKSIKYCPITLWTLSWMGLAGSKNVHEAHACFVEDLPTSVFIIFFFGRLKFH